MTANIQIGTDFVIAKCAIRQLHAHYTDAVWRQDWDAFGNCFAADCEWRHGGNVMRGRKEIVDYNRGLFTARFRKLLVSKGYNVHETVDTLAGPYDAILTFHVVEHLPDPVQTLKNLAGNLAPDGMIYLEVPNVNDALNTIVPYQDPFYYSRRPNIAVPAGQVLQIGSDSSGKALGLHPRLTGLSSIFNEGRLAVMQRTGYNNSSRSHFTGLDIWGTGNPGPDYNAEPRKGDNLYSDSVLAIDPDTGSSITIHVYVDGVATVVTADATRTDLAPVFPGYGSAHGYVTSIPVTAGPHTVCVYALDDAGGPNPSLGCRSV